MDFARKMTLLLALVSFGIVLGYLAGGRLSNLSRRHVRWPGLAAAGLVLQVIPASGPGSRVTFVLYLASFVLLLGFALLNLRASGFWLVAIGLLLNLTVIAVNRGMPVSRDAVAAAGRLRSLPELVLGHDPEHHVAGPGDRLLPLADVIGIRYPFGAVVSPGDFAVYGGSMWFVVVAMRRRPDLEPEPGPGAELLPPEPAALSGSGR